METLHEIKCPQKLTHLNYQWKYCIQWLYDVEYLMKKKTLSNYEASKDTVQSGYQLIEAERRMYASVI